jgi:hypothetical protein
MLLRVEWLGGLEGRMMSVMESDVTVCVGARAQGRAVHRSYSKEAHV